MGLVMKEASLKTTVFIIDDDIDLCQSLCFLLESVGLTAKVFNSIPNFLNTLTAENLQGCILLDIRMPKMSGLELQEQLNSRNCLLPIIFMTGHGDIAMAVRAMKAGAFDFITKPFNDQVLLDQIQKAIAHFQKFAAAREQITMISKRLTTLTHREKEVLELMVEGNLNKEIAYELKISIKTVELHRSHIMQKMHAATAAELIKFYLLATKATSTA